MKTYFTSAITVASLFILSTETTAQSWTANSSNLITSGTNNVGIGISMPLDKLTVNDGNLSLTRTNDNGLANWRYITCRSQYSALSIGTDLNLTNGNTVGPMLQMYAAQQGWRSGQIYYQSYAPQGYPSWGSAHTFQNFNAGFNQWINLMSIIEENGKSKVIIGNVTAPSGYSLYVERGILTEKLKLAVSTTQQWSDYVFNKDYKRMSLDTLEQYVSVNHHLPNVPSAQDVVNDGLDMAAMDAKLLEKIEELTLYTIELQKQLKEQQKQIQVLQETARKE